jgi:hypothetical protein
LDAKGLKDLKATDASLHDRLVAARSNSENVTRREHSTMGIASAKVYWKRSTIMSWMVTL